MCHDAFTAAHRRQFIGTIILSPSLVNVAFITSSRLDMITAESGADTLNRNLFLRQRFAFARQRFDRTIALLGLPRLHIPITKIAVARSRYAGHRGVFPDRDGGHPRTPVKGCITAL